MPIPTQNKAIYLGWSGAVDTKLEFADFFHKEFTIAAWYMPQYPHAYQGPLFADNGGKVVLNDGFFSVGHGDYRKGDAVLNKTEGSPVFMVRVGNKTDKYLLPELKAGKWSHIALVRTHEDLVVLFVNGTFKLPVKDAKPAAFAIVSSSKKVYVWTELPEVSSAILDPDSKGLAFSQSKPCKLPAGKTPANIVGAGIAGSDKHRTYVWYDDGIVSTGKVTNLNQLTFKYKAAFLKAPSNIVAMAIDGTDDRVYTWYDDQTVSIGSITELDEVSKPIQIGYKLPDGKSPKNIAGIAIASSKNEVYTWYDDKTFSSGTYTDLAQNFEGWPYNGRNFFKWHETMEITAADQDLPKGTLRFGRRGPGRVKSKRNWQAYGILDDVAVFDTALSKSEIKKLIANKRLTEKEKNVVAAWTFDISNSQAPPGPTKFYSWHKKKGRSYSVPVSADRDEEKDTFTFINPFTTGETEFELRLPFKKDQEWKVSRGYDDPDGTHNGYASFCWDFVTQDGAGNKPVFAVARGQVVKYRIGHVPPPGQNEGNYVRLRIGNGEYFTYLHLKDGSFNPKIKGGKPTGKKDGEFFFPDGTGPWIEKDELIAKVGPSGKHLHFAAGNNKGSTLPVAFAEYEVWNDTKNKWMKIIRGIPQVGQKIRRTK